MSPETRPATTLKLVETGATAEPASNLVKPPPSPKNDEDVGIEAFRAIDRMREALAAQLTAGISPAALALAFFDWSIHLGVSPGKQIEIAWKAARKAGRFAAHAIASGVDRDAPPCIEPLPGDNRFAAEAWKRPPFNLLLQCFLLQQQWSRDATTGIPGIVPHHEDVVSFLARQLLDMYSPSNNPFTNPEVIDRTLSSGGMNFMQGVRNWIEDASRLATGRPPVGAESFVIGRDVAVTPGKVVFRNHLIELIQYAPATETVVGEPILIVPAWIMKYYILDLSPDNSLIRYLVQQGYTVFCISWRNPTAEDRDLGFDDYRRLGVMAALDAISAIVPGRKIHATGYCLGGILLSIASAAMARVHDDRVASLTLFATETDFTEPGELALFVDHSGLHYLGSMMWNKGYLSADQMAGAFGLLRSNDLVWSRHIHEYMMGERAPMTDLMAWNADTTRMPYRMHSEYMQHLYVDNEFAAGRFMVDGRPAAIQNIRVPMFVVATERDHVAPWRSVYKIHHLSDTELTFVLANGGHNAGIVSEPGHRNRRYRIALMRPSDLVSSPEEWAAAATPREGSWWVAWAAWLAEHSTPGRAPPPSMGAPDCGFVPLADAPGDYVHQR